MASCDICDYICDKCRRLHKSPEKSFKYSDHKVLLFKELSHLDDGLHNLMLKRTRSNTFVQHSRNKCKVHAGEPNTDFCLDCKTYICHTCIQDAHSQHDHKVASLAAEECKGVLEGRVPAIRVAQRRALEGVEGVKKRKEAVKDQRLALSSSIDATFQRLWKIMEKRKQELKEKLGGLTERKLVNLSTQQLELERLATEMERMGDFTEEVVESSTDRELLTIYPFLHERITAAAQVDHLAGPRLPQPREPANMALKSTAVKHLTELCRRDLELYLDQACPGACSLETMGGAVGGVTNGLGPAQTLQYSQFVVNVVNRNKLPCPCIQDVSVRVKCLENGFETSTLVRDRGGGRYHVSFCPEFRGRHQIHVAVNGRDIAGSPFSLSVVMPHSQLGRCCQGCIQDVTQPRGIVLTPQGHIMICEWNGNRIVEMDRVGRTVRVLRSEGISHPASLALSDAGDIFVVKGTRVGGGVVKWDRFGRLARSVFAEGEGQAQFQSPRGVRISPRGDEVYVCDRDNARLQVFDVELRYLRCLDLQPLERQLGLATRPRPSNLVCNMRYNDYNYTM